LSDYNERHLLSQPIKLHFAGWESDTFKLQQNGWSLSVAQNHYRNCLQIAMKHHEYKIRGITSTIPYENLSYPGKYYQGEANVNLSSDFVQHTAATTSFKDFTPIDANPQYTYLREMMSENLFFAPNLARTQELIIPEHDVDSLMEMILKKQAINREDLIRRRVREQGLQETDYGARTNVHAQIVSIAS